MTYLGKEELEELRGGAEALRRVVEAAEVAARYMPPPSFMPGSPGYVACRALRVAVKEYRRKMKEGR